MTPDEAFAAGVEWVDEFCRWDLSEVIREARGREHDPSVVEAIRQRRACLARWRTQQISELRAELLAEFRGGRRYAAGRGSTTPAADHVTAHDAGCLRLAPDAGLMSERANG